MDQLQGYLEKQQQKYEKDLDGMNDVSYLYANTNLFMQNYIILHTQWNARQSERMKRIGSLVSSAHGSIGRMASPAAVQSASPQHIPKEIDQ